MTVEFNPHLNKHSYPIIASYCDEDDRLEWYDDEQKEYRCNACTRRFFVSVEDTPIVCPFCLSKTSPSIHRYIDHTVRLTKPKYWNPTPSWRLI